ncbi:MAG TPA: hypothetical protein VI589_05095 [Vicinamibacteria bacterium]
MLQRRMPRFARPSPCLERLDRLAWSDGACIESHGLRIGIRVNDAAALDELERRLPPDWRPSPRADVERLFSVWLGDRSSRVKRYHLVYAGISRRARTLDRDEALGALEAELRQAVAAGARRRVFVHAGVVGWRGRAIVIPGRSGAGKTTLVTELVRAGATYYSDEFAVLDAAGRVHPYAKDLSIRGEGDITVNTPVEALGGHAGATPLRPILFAVAAHRPGARWRPQHPTPGRALLALLAHTVPVRRRPRASLRALEAALRDAVVLQGNRGEARQTADALLRAADRMLETSKVPERGAA